MFQGQKYKSRGYLGAPAKRRGVTPKYPRWGWPRGGYRQLLRIAVSGNTVILIGLVLGGLAGPSCLGRTGPSGGATHAGSPAVGGVCPSNGGPNRNFTLQPEPAGGCNCRGEVTWLQTTKGDWATTTLLTVERALAAGRLCSYASLLIAPAL